MRARIAINRTMWFFAIVYAVEGTCQAKSGIMWQPLSHWLKETIHWDPVTISASLAILDLPWIIKPLWGAISDFVPLFGYRRRPWLVLANIAAFLAFAWVATIDTTAAMIPALTVTAIAMAVSSTLCGALLVETGQKTNSSASFVNQQWLWFNIAQMLAVLIAGFLIEMFSPVGALHVAACIGAAAPLAIVAGVWLIDEPRARIDLDALRERLSALLSVFGLFRGAIRGVEGSHRLAHNGACAPAPPSTAPCGSSPSSMRSRGPVRPNPASCGSRCRTG